MLTISDIDAENPKEFVSEASTVKVEIKGPMVLGSVTRTSPSPSCGEENEAPIITNRNRIEMMGTSGKIVWDRRCHRIFMLFGCYRPRRDRDSLNA